MRCLNKASLASAWFGPGPAPFSSACFPTDAEASWFQVPGPSLAKPRPTRPGWRSAAPPGISTPSLSWRSGVGGSVGQGCGLFFLGVNRPQPRQGRGGTHPTNGPSPMQLCFEGQGTRT